MIDRDVLTGAGINDLPYQLIGKSGPHGKIRAIFDIKQIARLGTITINL